MTLTASAPGLSSQSVAEGEERVSSVTARPKRRAGRHTVHGVHALVKCSGKDGAEGWAKPVDPVLGDELPTGYSRSQSAGTVDTRSGEVDAGQLSGKQSKAYGQRCLCAYELDSARNPTKRWRTVRTNQRRGLIFVHRDHDDRHHEAEGEEHFYRMGM